MGKVVRTESCRRSILLTNESFDDLEKWLYCVADASDAVEAALVDACQVKLPIFIPVTFNFRISHKLSALFNIFFTNLKKLVELIIYWQIRVHVH